MVGLVKKNYKKVLASLLLAAAIALGGCTINIEGLDGYVIDIVGGCGDPCGCGGCGYDYDVYAVDYGY